MPDLAGAVAPRVRSAPGSTLDWLVLLGRLLVGGVWIAAGASKLGDLDASVRAVRAYQLLPELAAQVLGAALPPVEILLGVLLTSNGVNLLFLIAAGYPGTPPIVGLTDEKVSDPLPQAMVLTAIVITMAVAAFVLTLAYRSFQLHGHDEVADDVEDARIRELADADVASESYEDTTFSDTGANVVSE